MNRGKQRDGSVVTDRSRFAFQLTHTTLPQRAKVNRVSHMRSVVVFAVLCAFGLGAQTAFLHFPDEATRYALKLSSAPQHNYVPRSITFIVGQASGSSCTLSSVQDDGTGLAATMTADYVPNSELPQTVKIRWGNGIEAFLNSATPNTDYTETLTIRFNGGCPELREDITLRVLQQNPYVKFSYPNGQPRECSFTDPKSATTDSCYIPDERPWSGAGFNPFTQTHYTDPLFGFTARAVGPKQITHVYSNQTPWDGSGNELWLSGNGAFFRYDTDGSLTGGVPENGLSLGGSAVGSHYFTTAAGVYLAFGNTAIYRRSVVDARLAAVRETIVTTADLGLSGTFRTGGEHSISEDNWIAFTSPADEVVCAMNVTLVNPSNKLDHIYCSSYASRPLQGGLGAAAIYAHSVVLDKQFLLLLDNSAWKPFQVYSVNTSTPMSVGFGGLTFEYFSGEHTLRQNSNNGGLGTGDGDGLCTSPNPQNTDYCVDGQHTAIFLGSDGHPYMLDKTETEASSFLVLYDISTPQMTLPVEAGGGMRILYPYGWNDMHASCFNNRCAITTSNPVQTGNAGVAVAFSETNPARITKPAHGLTTGTVVYVDTHNPRPNGRVPACLEGVSTTITVIDPDTFSLDGIDCSGISAYPGTTIAYQTADPRGPFRSMFRSWISLYDFNTGIVTPLVMHRSHKHGALGTAGNYSANPFATINRTGSKIAFKSNFGWPFALKTYVIDLEQIPATEATQATTSGESIRQ